MRDFALNEAQYRSLCEACDRVLLAPDASIERVAIQWLHIIREHPALLEGYAELFAPINGKPEIRGQWRRRLRRVLGGAHCFWKAINSRRQCWVAKGRQPGNIDVLLVSHFVDANHVGLDADFYYGKLPDELSVRGYSVVVALINHSSMPAATICNTWRASVVPRVVLGNTLALTDELKLYGRLRRESSRLSSLADREQEGLFRRVLVRASEEVLSGGAEGALRIAIQIGELAAKVKPGAVVVTHEGHAWERVVFAAARRAHPSVKCIGYQHAALFRLQHAVRRRLHGEYNPDHILAAGSVPQESLRRSSELAGVPISVLGSNRSFRRANNTNPLAVGNNMVRSRAAPACLVLPEGIKSECHLLFEFSLACARARPDIVFIWRVHPIVNINSLVKENPKLGNLPGNIVLSKASIDVDISKSCWVLYRGTTAVIQAVMAGLRPIYLQQAGEMTVDPLYALGEWRKQVISVSDFEGIIHADASGLDLKNESALADAQKYCESLFSPIDIDSLIAVLPVDEK